MAFYTLTEKEAKELIPGFHGKFIHSEHMTMAYWDIKKDSLLPEHSHPHEQVANVLEGEFELVVNGEARRLGPGTVAVIPSGVPHSGKAITNCRILDIFTPKREEYT